MENYGSILSIISTRQKSMINSLMIIISNSRVNCLLVFIPLGYLAHRLEWGDTWVFVLIYLALIPFAKLFGFVVEDISLQVDKKLGFLLRVILGNAVELIFFIIALKDRRIRIIQSMLLGSIILNLLLVSGMCYKIQNFKDLSLTTLAYSSLIIPAAFNFAVESIDDQLLSLPYVMTTVILILIILYRYFQIKRNLDIYPEEEQHQRLSIVLSLIFLGSLMVVVAFSAEYLINSIERSGISKSFISRILLPIICDAELVTAIGKVFSTIGSSKSKKIIILFTILIALGWQMKLNFQPLNTIYISCLVACHLIQRYKLQKFKRRILRPDRLPY